MGATSEARGSKGTRLARLEERGARGGMSHAHHGRHGNGIMPMCNAEGALGHGLAREGLGGLQMTKGRQGLGQH